MFPLKADDEGADAVATAFEGVAGEAGVEQVEMENAGAASSSASGSGSREPPGPSGAAPSEAPPQEPWQRLVGPSNMGYYHDPADNGRAALRVQRGQGSTGCRVWVNCYPNALPRRSVTRAYPRGPGAWDSERGGTPQGDARLRPWSRLPAVMFLTQFKPSGQLRRRTVAQNACSEKLCFLDPP